MLKNKNIDKICLAVIALTVVIALLFTLAASSGLITGDNTIGYENRLFDTERVHTIDIEMDDWEGFLETATSEEYSACTLVIDGEKYADVGIRGKGNTSLSSVAAYGNDRYSFKLEFDQYVSGKSYYGLDKLSLNNLISDNTYLKDYMCYTMMRDMGVSSPLCSFVYITVNGEDWGLYLAVEGVEESFLQRNYGTDYGELYKPDSLSMGGGGPGNGKEFDFEDFQNSNDGDGNAAAQDENMPEVPQGEQQNGGFDRGEPPEGFDPESMPQGGPGGMGGGMGSDDVKLQYIDDDPESYSNIFSSAKTKVSEADEARLISSLKALSEGGEEAAAVVDIEAVIKYFAVHDFVCNGDSYTGSMIHNYYLYEENGVLSMIPWDYNLAFGAFNNMGGGRGGSGESTGEASTVNSPIDSPVSGADASDRPMLSWIFDSEEYTALYHRYYAQFISEYFDSGYFEEMLDKVVSLISPYVQKDPTAFCSYEEFEAGVSALREFCLLRAESVSGQLDGSIPSTEEGQTADSSALIDASKLNISDMGQFSGGGGDRGDDMAFGGKGEQSRGDGQAPENALTTTNAQASAEKQLSPSE